MRFGAAAGYGGPDKEFVLLDGLGKRIRFIRQVCHELKLDNVTAVQARVEEYQDETQFDGVISRAFASLNDMLVGVSIYRKRTVNFMH